MQKLYASFMLIKLATAQNVYHYKTSFFNQNK